MIAMSATDLISTLRVVYRHLNQVATRTTADLGIGPKQALLLMRLHESGPGCLADLGRLSDSDPSAMTRMIDGLVEKTLVNKRPSAEDRRRYDLELTAEGRRIAQVFQSRVAKIEEELAAGLTPDEKTELVRLLHLCLKTPVEADPAASPAARQPAPEV